MRKEALIFPKSILIETLNICQGECKFCPYQNIRAGEKTTFLNFERYKEMIKEISYYDVKRLTLFDNNEPLIDPRIYEFIKYAYDNLNDVELTLSTNGRLLSKEVLIKLKESGLTHLYVSIPTVNKENYYHLMGNDIIPILNLLKGIDDKKLLKMIRIAVPKTKYYEPSEMTKELGKYTICAWDLEYRGAWNMESIFDEITDHLDYTGPCDRPLDQMVISSNGNVIICCRDWKYENIIGNIYENTLYEIWHNEKMTEIQKLIVEQNYNAINCCKDCNMNIAYYNQKIKRRTYEKK